MTKVTEKIKAMLAEITDQIKTLKSSPTQKDSPKTLEPTNVVPNNNVDSPLDGGQSTKIGGMWTLKNEISSPRLY